MNFFCKDSKCAIAISKATFPVAMNCPVCQNPLQVEAQTSNLTEVDELLLQNLPYVIAYPLKQTLLEQHAATRINLFRDTFLNYLKYLGLLTASEFFNSPFKDKKIVALFQQNLAEPSFGSWNHFIRECLKFLKEKNHAFICDELITYYELVETGKKRKLFKAEIEYIDGFGDVKLKKQEATSIGMLINFRNRYLGHGLTLDTETSEKLWNEYFPIFRSLLEQLTFSNRYPMYKREGNQNWLLQSSEISSIDSNTILDSSIWVENTGGKILPILPFYILPGEVALDSDAKAKVLAYESFTGKTIKFF